MTPAERSQLFETLSELSLGDFEWLVFSLKPPAGIVPPDIAPQKSRVAALLGWADSFGECSLSEVQTWLNKLGTMTASQSPLTARFREYLDLVSSEYQIYWKRYAFIDEISEGWFEFELNTEVERKNDREENTSKEPKAEKQSIIKAVRENDNKSLLIHGKSGSGKSTLLAKLFYEAALKAQRSESDLIPVLIELKSYEAVGESPGIQGLILKTLQNYNPELDENDLKQIKKQKKLRLFIDGFNELADGQAKIKIKEYCKNIPTIVTSRSDSDWREIEKKLEIDPLSPQEVANFFRERLPGSSQANLEALGNRVKDFGETPLMVWMLYSIFNTSKEIPETRGEAYRRFTTFYVEQAKEGIDLAESRILLGKLAFEMTKSYSSDNAPDFRLVISEVDAQHILGSEAILKLLRNCHLLNSRGQPGNRRISFCHQSLQEYYAAEELLIQLKDGHPDFSNDQRLQYFYLNYTQWTESFYLLANFPELGHKQSDRLINLALDIDWMLGARLAGKMDASQVKIRAICQINSLTIPTWLKAELLKASDSDEAIPYLLELLCDEDFDAVQTSIQALGNLKCKESIHYLTVFLESDGILFQCCAAEALGNIGSEAAISTLIKALNNWHPFVRTSVAKALAKLSSEENVSDLLKVFEDGNDSVRESILQTLGELGYQQTIPYLLKVLENEEEIFQVRVSALEVLFKIGELDTLNKAFALIDDESINVRCSLAAALQRVENEKAIPFWLLLLKDKHPLIISAAAERLSEIGDKSIIPKLMETDFKNSFSVLISILKAIHKLGDEQFTSSLLSLLDDSNPSKRLDVVRVLGEVNCSEAISYLLEILRTDENIDIRRQAVESLGKLKSKEAVDELHEILKNNTEDFQMLETTAAALGKLNAKQAIPDLINLLNHPNNWVRWKSVEALGNIGDPSAVTDLLKKLEDDDEDVRIKTAKALAKYRFDFVTYAMPKLQQLMIKLANKEAFQALSFIQANCGFYNYKIQKKSERFNLEEELGILERPELYVDAKILQIIQAGSSEMTKSKYNIKAEVAQIIEENTGTIIGKQVRPTITAKQGKALGELSELVKRVQSKHPNATEKEVLEKLIQGFEVMSKQNSRNWQAWRDLLSVLFSGGVETIKVFEPFVGIPIAVLMRLHEIYDRNQIQLSDK